MVAVPAHEAHDAAGLGHQLHPERFVEGLASVEVADVQVHVTEHSAGRELGLRRRGDPQQTFEVEMLDADAQPPIGVLPRAPRPIGVDLYPVSFRIVEVEGLAHQVIGRPGKRKLLLQGATQKAAQLLLRRKEDREMVEAGGMPRPRATVRERRQA